MTKKAQVRGSRSVYAVASLLPVTLLGGWTQAEIDDFCALTSEEADLRLRGQ